ncbi:hypothetical protein V8C35DRAFT_326323 [Trichoderma chlorosporum]
MSALTPRTEVQEMELDSSNLMITLYGPKTTDDETAGILQLELLDRVEEILENIGQALSFNFHKLPSEVQQLGVSERPSNLLQRLNIIVKHHVLDDFFQDHPRCRQWFSQLFSCRYPYLQDQNSEGSEGNNESACQTASSDGDFQACPLNEAFKSRHPTTDSVGWQPITNENGDVENTVTWAKEAAMTVSPKLASKDALAECIDAYNAFQTLYDGSSTLPISLKELEIAEKMYQHMDGLLSKESVSKVPQEGPSMGPQLKTAFTECFANLTTISQKFQDDLQKKVFGQIPAKSGIELELTIGPSNSEEDSEGDEYTDDELNHEDEFIDDTKQRPGIPFTPSDLQLQPYKGWYIEGPRIQLARAKNFLADGDIDRTVDWERKFAELTEYFAYLYSTHQGEDWIHDLKEAVDVLRAHRIFENYYYGKKPLIVDFPTDLWPKQSTRLPQLPGPNIMFCAGSSKQLDLTGPRRLLHADVASVHDRQYEMPADVLRNDYLEPYRNDSEKFWAASSSLDTTESGNLAAYENEMYEDCMKGGMAKTAGFLASKDGFRPSHQRDDSALPVQRQTLEAFAQFRGGKRAALQQCLNVFNHDENRKMSTPWRILTLPEPFVEKKPDAGIIYTNKMLENPPEKESRDPWAYTRAYQWFKKEELRWAQWTREDVIKKSYDYKRWRRSDKPVMELPRNWKGPVLPDLMDRDMKRTYKFLRRCQTILQGLKRAKNRAPRDFIMALLETVDIGLAAMPVTKEMKLLFGEHEYESTDGIYFTLATLRPMEAAWLEYVCQPSRNRPHELEESLGRRGEIMLSRVTRMMQDIDPFSLFRDTAPKSMEQFLRELNSTCGGEVKRYEFTEKDVSRLAPKLRDLKVLKNKLTGELMFGRPETEFHPEDLVKWPNHEPQIPSPLEQNLSVGDTLQAVPQSKNTDQIQADKGIASDDSISTHPAASAPAEDFLTHPEDMPRREDVASLQEFIDNPVRNPEWRERTANFFFCLGYRLGKTLRELQSRHEENEKKLSDPKTQEHNSEFLAWLTTVWGVDTKMRPTEAEEASWRITMMYPDVVKIADPDAYKEQFFSEAKEWPPEGEAYELVRKNLLREAHENKTMLWPLHLPYNSYATRYKVADRTIWRRRSKKIIKEVWMDNSLDEETKESRVKTLQAQLQKEEEEEEKKQDAIAAQKQNLKTMRREPVWTFGHPSRKKPVHLFFDINNWPVHLQSESRQRIIRSRGPARRQASDDEAAADIGEDMAAFAEELEEAAEMPLWKRAEQRRKFMPGGGKFWMGDTPLQRKEFEARMKKRLAPPSKKRTWGGALKEALGGMFAASNESVAASDEGFGLPSVLRHLIPQSRPAKRRRITGPLPMVGEERERDLFAIARGENEPRSKSNVITMTSRSSSLAAGQVTFYIPETRLQGEGGVEDVTEVDEPFVEYVMPAK